MNQSVACGPDHLSNIVHGGMALSAIGLGCVFMWLLVNMLRTNSMYGIGYTFYWLSGFMWLFVSIDLFRWAVRVVML